MVQIQRPMVFQFLADQLEKADAIHREPGMLLDACDQDLSVRDRDVFEPLGPSKSLNVDILRRFPAKGRNGVPLVMISDVGVRIGRFVEFSAIRWPADRWDQGTIGCFLIWRGVRVVEIRHRVQELRVLDLRWGSQFAIPVRDPFVCQGLRQVPSIGFGGRGWLVVGGGCLWNRFVRRRIESMFRHGTDPLRRILFRPVHRFPKSGRVCERTVPSKFAGGLLIESNGE